ncbi:MAG: amidase [Rhodospirillales bacterium]
MDITEYAARDGLGLAELVKKGDVTPKELAQTAAKAVEAVDGRIKAVVETYPDRIDDLDESALGAGPFQGVPFLIKDVGGHEKGRKIEYGSRLCEGMTAKADTNFIHMLRAAGVNVLGRSNTPEYSIASSAENLLYGATSTPWREGFSAGGSTGGGAAAVAAGMVPLAHGSDIAGSIRIPASWCGGVGLKPSRGMVSAGPGAAEAGFGMAMNFVQTKTMRDTAAMMDCLTVPQPGDPFIVRRPEKPYADFLRPPDKSLKIAWTAAPLMPGAPVDAETAAAAEHAANMLDGLGYAVEEAHLPFDLVEATQVMLDHWFFGFDKGLEGYARVTGRKIGPETLEPVTLKIYEWSKNIDPARFTAAIGWMNTARRKLGEFFAAYDVLISPSAAMPSPKHGLYGLDIENMEAAEYMIYADKPVQFCFHYNVMGAPAISLPLAMHSEGLPIGVQFGARPQHDEVLISMGALFEDALPWRDRRPPLGVLGGG